MSGDCAICSASLYDPHALPVWRFVYHPRQMVKLTTKVKTVNVVITKCGHCFHRTCLVNHLNSKMGMLPYPHKLRNAGTCPTCRTKIFVRELHPVNLGPRPTALFGGPAADGGDCQYCKGRLMGPFGGAPCSPLKKAKFPHLARSNICCTPCGHLYHTNCYLKDLTDSTVYTNKRNTGICINCKAKIYILKTYPVSFHRPLCNYPAPAPVQPVFGVPPAAPPTVQNIPAAAVAPPAPAFGSVAPLASPLPQATGGPSGGTPAAVAPAQASQGASGTSQPTGQGATGTSSTSWTQWFKQKVTG